DQHDVQAWIGFAQADRCPEPEIAAADDTNVCTCRALQRRSKMGVLRQGLPQPMASRGNIDIGKAAHRTLAQEFDQIYSSADADSKCIAGWGRQTSRARGDIAVADFAIHFDLNDE